MRGWRAGRAAGRTLRPMSWTAPHRVTQRGDPNIAAILTWLLPGAGHLYLGMPAFALGAFAVIEGLFFAGLRLSHGMGLEYIDADLRGIAAGALSPEAGNLGGLVWQMRENSGGFGPGFPRAWPEFIALGVALTALSGLANIILMVHAHASARSAPGEQLRARRVAKQVFGAWLLPGLGHWLQGRRRRGLLVFTLLLGMFALGTLLAHGSNLDRERHFYYWGGQFLVGLPALAAEFVHQHAALKEDIGYADAGLVFACLAGLLNVMALIDVYSFAEDRGTEATAPSKEGGEGSRAATADLSLPRASKEEKERLGELV